ncbi:hypothetical protein OnM2_025070 [Erysiphe neolycopersici]|uniref:Uncharacterized protein n=1 Tax=Erysiphe neolycopersici TaxID=212602 RepID=A0A420I1D5_9PEZI|nr:hypothetical protein OnM2_025070 [Erysiphe neolycopersici]
MRELENLINAQNTDDSFQNLDNKAKLKEDHNSNQDKHLATLSVTIKRLEAKIDSLETSRPSGLNKIKKLAPDNMPGPCRPNNLMNCQNLRSENLSGTDTPTLEIYIKSI